MSSIQVFFIKHLFEKEEKHKVTRIRNPLELKITGKLNWEHDALRTACKYSIPTTLVGAELE